MRIFILLLFALLGSAFVQECNEAQYEFFGRPVAEIPYPFGLSSSPLYCVAGTGNTFAVMGLSGPVSTDNVQLYFILNRDYAGLEITYKDGDVWTLQFTETTAPLMISQFTRDGPLFKGFDFGPETRYILIFGTIYQ